MTIDPEFLEVTRHNAIHKWKWRQPWVAAILGTIPLGMLYTSVGVAIVYCCICVAWANWEGRPKGVSLLIMLAFGAYAYHVTRWRNAAIERWKYGLPGTGTQNPKGMTPISEEEPLERTA